MQYVFVEDVGVGPLLMMNNARPAGLQLSMAGLMDRPELRASMFLTCQRNGRHGAAAGPACVSGWTKTSCRRRKGELLTLLGSSPPQPLPPGGYAASLNNEERSKKKQTQVRDGKIELT